MIKSGHRVEFNEAGTSCFVERGETLQGVDLNTSPYPGYPTDMQAQMTALLVTTPGISVVKDSIFPQRFMHCAELKRMGADIKLDHGTAIVRGVAQLSAAPVMASDLRASAALVLAALRARGTTEISRL
jgi:UDP-N-acetylglucosamine 1-carboxyvinyltransferase